MIARLALGSPMKMASAWRTLILPARFPMKKEAGRPSGSLMSGDRQKVSCSPAVVKPVVAERLRGIIVLLVPDGNLEYKLDQSAEIHCIASP